jgi:predicted DNA-binding transcriptional regulator YafY
MPAKTTHQERHIRKRLDLLDHLLRHKKLSYPELLDELNEAIELHGDVPISERTLKNDLKYLLEEEGAPIHKSTPKDRRLYYTRPFSIQKMPLDQEEINMLANAIQILKGLHNFTIVSEVEGIVRKLESNLFAANESHKSFIHFEQQPSTSGSEHVDDLLEAIKENRTIQIHYHPFNKPEPLTMLVHPYLLKEFRNRWFLLGRKEEDSIESVFALDRIRRIKPSSQAFLENDLFDPATYFDHLVGVSTPRHAQPEKIILFVRADQAPYISSKPIHSRQQIIEQHIDGSLLLELNLVNNYELRSVLLSYGAGVEVVYPMAIRLQMKELLIEASHAYQTPSVSK